MSKLTDLGRFALDVLDGKEIGLRELLDLAQKLTDEDAFSLARDLLDHARQEKVADKENARAEKTRIELAQKHALYTYKASDTPLEKSLVVARDILEKVDNLTSTKNQETLGLAGAIAKRLWQETNKKFHLEESLRFYLRGHEQGAATDGGYNGINAAYVQDVLARLEDDEARSRKGKSARAASLRQQAEIIRRELIEFLPTLAKKKPELNNDWWHFATMAEAHLGLGNCEESAKWLERAKTLSFVPKWMYETTARQLASLARLVPEPEDRDQPNVLPVDVLIDLIRGRCRPAGALVPVPIPVPRKGVWPFRGPWYLWILLGFLLALPWGCRRDLWPRPWDRTADLAVKLSANASCAEVGGTIIYTVEVKNNGPRRAVDIRDTIWGSAPPLRLMTEDLERNVVDRNGINKSGVDTLEFRVVVRPEMTTPLVMTAVVSSGRRDPATGAVSGGRHDPVTANDTSSVRIPIEGTCPPELRLSKQASAATVSPEDTLRYTLAVVNSGDSAVSDVRVIDTLPEGVRFIPARIDSAVRRQVTSAGRVITWAVRPLARAESASVTLPVIVTAVRGALTNTAIISGVPNTRRVVDTRIVSRPGPILVVTKRAGLEQVRAGESLTYTLQVRNRGAAAAESVVLRDVLPARTSFTRASGNGDHRDGIVTWRVDALAAGASFTRTVEVVAPGGCVRSLRNAASVTEQSGRGNQATAQTRVVDPSCPDSMDLGVTLTASPDPVMINGTVTDSARVTNYGPGIATNVVLRTGTRIVWPDSGFTLQPRESRVITRSTVVTGRAPRTIMESVTVTGDPRDWNTANDRAMDSTRVLPDSRERLGRVLARLSDFYVRDSVSFEVLIGLDSSSTVVVVDTAGQRDTVFTNLSPKVPFSTVRVDSIVVKHPPTAQHRARLVRDGAARIIAGQFPSGTARVKKFVATRHSLGDTTLRFTGGEPDLRVGPAGTRDSVFVEITFRADSINVVDRVRILRSPNDDLSLEVIAYLRQPNRFTWMGVIPSEEPAIIEGLIVIGQSPP